MRTRLRRPCHVKVSKGRTRTRKLDIAPGLRAPISAEIEDDLTNLVARFGEKKVLEALDPLITKCKWNDWQCVANAIRRIAARKRMSSDTQTRVEVRIHDRLHYHSLKSPFCSISLACVIPLCSAAVINRCWPTQTKKQVDAETPRSDPQSILANL
jgi:hypothetical protein